MPENTAAAPISARSTWASESATSSSPGLDVQPQAELVGHRAGRREQRVLVAEQVGDPLLERADRGVLAEHVVADRRRAAIASRIAVGGPGQGVGQQVDAAARGGARRRSVLASISATRNASSRLCWWFSRGSQTVS